MVAYHPTLESRDCLSVHLAPSIDHAIDEIGAMRLQHFLADRRVSNGKVALNSSTAANGRVGMETQNENLEP